MVRGIRRGWCVLLSVVLAASLSGTAYADLGTSYAGSSEAETQASQTEIAVELRPELLTLALGSAEEGTVFTDAESGLVFQVVAPGEVSVGTGETSQQTALSDPSVTAVSIPAQVEYEGLSYQVTSISAYAFYNTSIVSVELPEGLQTIGARAFKFCRSLEAVVIPSTVTEIEAYAFYVNNSLTTVTFAEGSQLTTLGSGVFAINNTLQERNPSGADTTASLESIVLPETLTSIPSYLFAGQYSMTSCTILSPELEQVGTYAFASCSSLTRLDIPVLTAEGTRIGSQAFSACSSLEVITFAGDMSDATSHMNSNMDFIFSSSVPDKFVFYDKGWDLYFVSYTAGTSYFTVKFYESQADAEAKVNSTGYITVRSGTAVVDVASGVFDDDDVVFEAVGYVPGAWEFEGSLTGEDQITDSLAAWPADVNDLSLGGVGYPDGSSEYIYRGTALDLDLSIYNAAGQVLTEGRDYEITVRTASGSSVDPTNIHAVGEYIATVQGIGSYTGGFEVPFSLNYDTVEWTRLAGSDRYATMSAIVSTTFDSYSYLVSNQGSADNARTDWAIVASGDNFPDALAASALAGALNCPVLLTNAETLSSQVSYQIYRIGARNIIVVGGEPSVSADVYSDLGDVLGVENVYRIAGDDRYETARLIYQYGSRAQIGAEWSDTCIVVSGEKYPDALSMSSYAYASSSPVFLANPTTGLSDQVLSAIASGGFSRVYIAGDENSVPASVVDQLERAGIPSSGIVRLSGDDRYETSYRIAEYFVSQGLLTASQPVIATGEKFPDALAGSALAGSTNSVLLLWGGSDSAAYEFLLEHQYELSAGYILGDENGISTADEALITAIFDS